MVCIEHDDGDKERSVHLVFSADGLYRIETKLEIRFDDKVATHREICSTSCHCHDIVRIYFYNLYDFSRHHCVLLHLVDINYRDCSYFLYFKSNDRKEYNIMRVNTDSQSL